MTEEVRDDDDDDDDYESYCQPLNGGCSEKEKLESREKRRMRQAKELQEYIS